MTDYNKAFKILSDRQFIYASLYDYPNECPYCHKTIIPECLNDYHDKSNDDIYATLLCPNSGCNTPFIAKYIGVGSSTYQFKEIVKTSLKQEVFSEEIIQVSPKFIKIYNEAFCAEQYKLNEICGVAYRKALEFLLKDYLISKYPNKKENIVNITISNCINTYIDDVRLKTTANRAIWLGNDQTHYEKRWESKDLLDLKVLIRITINWIESEILTAKYEKELKKK